MKRLKMFFIISIVFGIAFIATGYWLSDDKFFNDLIRENGIDTPEKAFDYVKKNTDVVLPNSTPVPFTTPRYLLAKRYLWCDEGAIVLATIVHELGNETQLVDVIKEDGIPGHTYLQIKENGEWKNYDTILKKEGLTHKQILEGFGYGNLKGYARPRPYPRLYNFIIQNNFYLKKAALWIRNVPG